MVVQSRYSYVEHNVVTRIQEYLSKVIPNSSTLDFQSVLIEISNPYSTLCYNCIPLNVYTLEEYQNIIVNIIINHLNRYRNIFQNCNNELKLFNLRVDKNIIEKSTTKNTKTNSGDSSGMSENAPINADIGSIVSPNTKAMTQTHASQNDNGSTDYTNTENNPYYYDTFLSIIKRYNIPAIINNGIQKILIEYSTII